MNQKSAKFFLIIKTEQRLRESQSVINNNQDISIIEVSEIQTSPLDVLTNIKTRWNSTLIAWKRILKLYNAMRHVTTVLLSQNDHVLIKEGEKLEKLCLTPNEKK